MARCQPCVEKKLRDMIRQRDAKINALEEANRQLNEELAAYKRKDIIGPVPASHVGLNPDPFIGGV